MLKKINKLSRNIIKSTEKKRKKKYNKLNKKEEKK